MQNAENLWDVLNGHICPAHYISGILLSHYINHAPICNPNYWGVTTEMILGRSNNHNPSNGSGRSNPHIVRVEQGAAKSTCSCLTNNNRNGSHCGALPFYNPHDECKCKRKSFAIVGQSLIYMAVGVATRQYQIPRHPCGNLYQLLSQAPYSAS